MAHGLPTSSEPAVSVLFLPLRAVRPIGWMGGRYTTSNPSSPTYGSILSASRKVPCRFGSVEVERGKNSYQELKTARSRSAKMRRSRSSRLATERSGCRDAAASRPGSTAAESAAGDWPPSKAFCPCRSRSESARAPLLSARAAAASSSAAPSSSSEDTSRPTSILRCSSWTQVRNESGQASMLKAWRPLAPIGSSVSQASLPRNRIGSSRGSPCSGVSWRQRTTAARSSWPSLKMSAVMRTGSPALRLTG